MRKSESQSEVSVDPIPRVLVVGGSDPSGAAGIQCDLKVLTTLSVFGCSAITAITVQNQHGVLDIMALPASLVLAQIDAAMKDAPCDVVKVGMLCSVDIAHGLAERASEWGAKTRLVVDPVLASTSGRSLLSEDARTVLIERLLPAAALVTPNLIEAEILTGQSARNVEEMSLLCDHLLARGASAVLLKGGHLLDRDPDIEEVTDILRTADGEETRFAHPRHQGPSCRGTGCALASAAAAGIAEGLTLQGAVERAIDFVQTSIRLAAQLRSVRALHPMAAACTDQFRKLS